MSSRSSSPEPSALTLNADVAPLPSYKSAATSAVDFDGRLTTPLKVHEDLTKGCGGQLWPAGMVLGKHMLCHHKDDIKEARILELGAGGGLVGLAVALGCPVEAPVYITDMEDMVALMQHNVILNQVEDRVIPLILNWGGPLPQAVVDFKPTHILAADCVYFEPAFPLLMETLAALFDLNPSAVVYFCFKRRRRADLQFMKTARKRFIVEEVEDNDKPIWERERLFLYRFKKRDAKS